MAQCLVEAGYPVTILLRGGARPLPPALAGQKVAYSVAEAAQDAQVALSVVTDDAAEEEIANGPRGLLKHLGPGAVHLCASTIGLDTSRRLAKAHQEAGQGYVAAPILGSPWAAAHRQLWFIAAGPDAQVTRCMPVLGAMGRGVTRVGNRAELAHALKLGTHLFALTTIAAMAEMLAFGEKAGYAPASYLRLLNLGQFKSPQADAWGALMVRHDHEPMEQTVDLAARGLELARQAAQELGLAMPLAAQLHQQVAEAREEGLGGLDVTALSMIRRRDAGLPGPWPNPTPARIRVPLPGGWEPPRTGAPREPPGQARPSPSAAPDSGSGTAEERAVPVEPAATPEPRPEFPAPEPIEPAAVAEPIATVQEPPVPVPCAPEPPAEAEVAASAPPSAGLGPGEAEASAGPDPGPAGPWEQPVPGSADDLAQALDRTLYYEEHGGMVWAWREGRRQVTPWRKLPDLEFALTEVTLVRVSRHISLNPQAVLELKPLLGGRARVVLTDGQQLTLGREPTRKLKFILGL
jgi:3-hydroxyisobutyrate dehydrogenase-like beta-hydroxyacid dehydrogenase